MLVRAHVAKDRKAKRPEPESEPPAAQHAPPAGTPEDEAEEEYTEHVLIPLRDKQRLDAIAFKVNAERKGKRLSKRPLGWFVVKALREWMDQAEARQKGQEGQ